MLCQPPKSQIKTIPAQQMILRVPSQSGGSWPNQKSCWMSQLLCTSWPLLLHTGGSQAPISTHLSQSCRNDGAVMLWFTQHKLLPTMQWQNQAEKKWCPTPVWWLCGQSTKILRVRKNKYTASTLKMQLSGLISQGGSGTKNQGLSSCWR